MSERHERDADVSQGRRPSDTEDLVGETAASRPLTDAERVVQPSEAASRERGAASRPGQPGAGETGDAGPAGDEDAEAELGHS